MSSVYSVVILAVVMIAGCRPPEEPAAERRCRILAQVIDEADFLAPAAQVEAAALDELWAELQSNDYIKLPARSLPVEKSLRTPERVRGHKVFLKGKLLVAERTGAPAGAGLKGLVLLPDGGLAAFRAQLPAGGQAEVPEVGSAVEVDGLFLKRWIALDGSKVRYVMVPLLASRTPLRLSGEESGQLARLEPAGGLMPVTELEVPPVTSRPVIELDARGALRLDGREISQSKLVAELNHLAGAAGRTPLGESALVAVVLVDPDAPAAVRQSLEKGLAVKAVFRTRR